MYHMGLYLRLSKQDLKGDSSDSIENQKRLLLSFLEDQPDMKVEEIYVDDGLTGTNFSRPAFQKMLSDAGKGRINGIVVKDFSRLGRNYLDTGNFIETVFPFLGVRLISVNDRYDSQKADNTQWAYLVPLKNIMNESFVRDISKKTKSAQRSKMKKGYFTGSLPAYGYEREPGSGRLRIDPIAAKTVKEIFDWSIEGYGDYKIAKMLNEKKILPPYLYKIQQGVLHKAQKEISQEWQKNMVAAILKNPVYTGTLIQNRKTTQSPKGKRVSVAANEWIISESTHEAIIEKKQFDEVQRQRKLRWKDQRKTPDRPKNAPLFRGKVYCGRCKKAMICCWEYGKYRYICSNRHGGGSCKGKSIQEDRFIAILDALEKIKKTLQEDEGSSRQRQKTNLQSINNNICLEKLYLAYQQKIISKQQFIEQIKVLRQLETPPFHKEDDKKTALTKLSKTIQRIEVYDEDRMIIKKRRTGK